jgi:hypothetical protein
MFWNLDVLGLNVLGLDVLILDVLGYHRSIDQRRKTIAEL